MTGFATKMSGMDEIIIRDYQPNDWHAVCAVHDASRPFELVGATDPRAFRPMSEVAREERFFDSRTFVACGGGSVIGFVSVEDSCITWLYVHPSFHRRGVGTMLLKQAMQECGPDAWLNTMAGNEAAIQFYKRSGFEVVKSFPSDCDGYPCTCLRLALPSSRMHDPNKQA